MTTAYEIVIGLEVHVQLLTQTKIFCGCPAAFGAPPNSHVCPVCLGLPGALPVLNRRALELGVRTALALHCEISPRITFDRKHYFYPDLPKNYQISQYDLPLSHHGGLPVRLPSGEKRIGITRAHLEEDAGKLLHEGVTDGSLVDFNRAGVPLLEIVSEPEMSSPAEAYAYLGELKAILQYLEVSDCNMEEGSLRCDVNVSLRPAGARELGAKVEVKNLNSFKAVRAALEYEARRQQQALEHGERIVQETRLWDADRAVTVTMRSKEGASDYRYFPEPDLVPFEIPAEEIARARETLPELPRARAERLMAQYQLTAYDAQVLTAEKTIANFFEAVVAAGGAPKPAAHWIMGDVMSWLNAQQVSPQSVLLDLPAAAPQPQHLAPAQIVQLLRLVDSGALSRPAAKDVLVTMMQTGRPPEEIMASQGLRQVSDAAALEAVVERVLVANAAGVDDFRRGKTNALMFLVGQCMKVSKGQANPHMIADMLRRRLAQSHA